MAREPSEIGAGRSTLLEAYDAGVAAAQQACAALGGAPTFCFVFATSGYGQEALLAGIRSVTKDTPLAGCSGEGVISGECSDERNHVVSVLAVRSAKLRLSVESDGGYAADSEDSARNLAAKLRAAGEEDLVGVILFVDGITGDCTRFLAELERHLPAHTVVVGGCAADDMSFERTYQYTPEGVMVGGVVAVAVRGAGSMRVAVSHGCEPVGLERTITRAAGGWVYELDGQPAWDVFKEYLPGEPQDLNAEGITHLSLGTPLWSHRTADDDPFVVRTPMQLDAKTGALFFPGGGMERGARTRLMRRDRGRIRRSAEECAARLADGRAPRFVIQLDCCGRGRVMFGNCATSEIVEPLQRALGKSTPWVGLHTYGEIAPVDGRLCYHNYTVALCAVYEDE